MKEPSKNQIEFANLIAKTLNLDFPRDDYDFNAQSYFLFIKDNISDFECAQHEIDDSYLYDDYGDTY